MDRLEQETGSAAKVRAEAEGDISLVVCAIKKLEHVTQNLSGVLENEEEELDHLKTEMEVLSRIALLEYR